MNSGDRFAGCLAELQRQALLPEPTLAAFVVGSVARGWANPTSDYDIYLVSTRPAAGGGKVLRVPLDPPTVPSAVTHVDGRRWELKFWLDSQVDQMLGKVSWEQFEDGRVAGQILVDTEELFLERLATCIPLAGEDWVRRRREEVAASAFRAYVVTRSLAESDGSVEDALGQLAAGDLDSAVLSARKAFGCAVDGLLESAGEYGYYTPKWRARRFRAANPAVMSFEEYWAIETMRDLDPADPRPWVEKVIRLSKDIAIESEI
jgi:Nucleotidyltransferase domain